MPVPSDRVSTATKKIDHSATGAVPLNSEEVKQSDKKVEETGANKPTSPSSSIFSAFSFGDLKSLSFSEGSDAYRKAKSEVGDKFNKALIKMMGEKDFSEKIGKISKKSGITLMHKAARYANQEVMAMILEKVPDPAQRTDLLKKPDKNGNTPMHYAAQNTDVMKVILKGVTDKDQLTDLLKEKGENDFTPMHWAANEEPAVMEAILNKAAEQKIDIKDLLSVGTEEEGQSGPTPMHVAAENEGVMTAILKAVTDPVQRTDLLKKPDKNGNTPMHYAAQNTDVMKVILKGVTDKDQLTDLLKEKGENDFTPMHWAANEEPAVMEAILNKAAEQKIDIKDLLSVGTEEEGQSGPTPMHVAAENQDAGVMKAILAKLPDSLTPEQVYSLLMKPNSKGATPMNLAAANKNPAVMAAILEKVPEDQLTDLLKEMGGKDLTPMHVAAKNEGIMTAILEKVINEGQLTDLLKQTDKNGNTPMHYAAKNADVMKAILKKVPEGQLADLLKEKGEDDFTPMHWAAKNADVMAAILNKATEKGIDINALVTLIKDVYFTRIDELVEKNTKRVEDVQDKLAELLQRFNDVKDLPDAGVKGLVTLKNKTLAQLFKAAINVPVITGKGVELEQLQKRVVENMICIDNEELVDSMINALSKPEQDKLFNMLLSHRGAASEPAGGQEVSKTEQRKVVEKWGELHRSGFYKNIYEIYLKEVKTFPQAKQKLINLNKSLISVLDVKDAGVEQLVKDKKDLLACLVSAAINIPVLNDKDEVENDVAQLQKKIVIKMWMNEKISDKDRDYFYTHLEQAGQDILNDIFESTNVRQLIKYLYFD